MPSRVIRGEFCESISMASVSIGAELTFVKLLLSVDDFGRIKASIRTLKAKLYPERDSVTKKRIEDWINELAAEGCILLYSDERSDYIQMTNWERHLSKQRRAKTPKLPSPEDCESGFKGIPGTACTSSDLPLGVGEGVGVGDECTSPDETKSEKPISDPRFPPDQFPGFRPLSRECYASIAADPAKNGLGVFLDPLELADWHAFVWSKPPGRNGKALSDYKNPARAMLNWLSRLGKYDSDELSKAARWTKQVRASHATRKHLADQESIPDPSESTARSIASKMKFGGPAGVENSGPGTGQKGAF